MGFTTNYVLNVLFFMRTTAIYLLISLNQAGSSTMKMLWMHISGIYKEETMKKIGNEKSLQALHSQTHGALKLSKNITQSEDPPSVLNDYLANQSIFSFSYVRHPYTR